MKTIVVKLIIVLVILSMFECSNKYKIGLTGGLKSPKEYYQEGETVRVVLDLIATDTDYSFDVEGAEFSVTYEKEGYVVTFNMPDHDVKVSYTTKNTMHIP